MFTKQQLLTMAKNPEEFEAELGHLASCVADFNDEFKSKSSHTTRRISNNPEEFTDELTDLAFCMLDFMNAFSPRCLTTSRKLKEHGCDVSNFDGE